METSDEHRDDGRAGRPGKAEPCTESTPEQRRNRRRAEQIRQMENLMRGAAAFAAKRGE